MLIFKTIVYNDSISLSKQSDSLQRDVFYWLKGCPQIVTGDTRDANLDGWPLRQWHSSCPAHRVLQFYVGSIYNNLSGNGTTWKK